MVGLWKKKAYGNIQEWTRCDSDFSRAVVPFSGCSGRGKFVILLLSQSGISVAIASDLRLAVWRVNPPSAKILTMFSFQCLITTYLFVSLRGPVFVPEL